MNARTKNSVSNLGEVIARFATFTGFWAVIYFYLCLTAFAVGRERWKFAVDLSALGTWFGVFVAISVALGIGIGIVLNLFKPFQTSSMSGFFGGTAKGTTAQTLLFLVATALSGTIFLFLAYAVGRWTERQFGFRLDVLNGVSFPTAVLAVTLESIAVTLLVMGIIFFVKRQYLSMKKSFW
jgi:hypothetical protein